MKAVIFDFNGTLFADSDKHRLGWKRCTASWEMCTREMRGGTALPLPLDVSPR